jgi:hypothetical protein
MSASTPLPEPAPPRADLVTLGEEHVGEIARFVAAQSGRSAEAVQLHLRWFLLGNPARESQAPLGFGLGSPGQLVGCILCMPQYFRFQNKIILFVGSSSFYVDERHRGYGGRIFLQYSRLGRRQPLFGTSANPVSAALWKAAGATPIPYSDGELFGVLRWAPVAEEFAHRRYSNRLLTRLSGSRISNIAALANPLKIDCSASEALHPLESAEQVNDLPIHVSSTKLTSLRNLPYIRWRYFSGRDSTVAAFAFRCHQPDRDVLVTVNQRIRGYRNQINTLNVLDVYPEVPSGEWLRIVGALIARYRNSVDAVVLRSQNPELQKTFCARGFRNRTFEAPTGWFLDNAKLLPTNDWYFVPADGDGVI